MRIALNGRSRQVDAATTVADLVRELTQAARGVAVAVDGEVVSRSAWPHTTLREDASVEILTATQGG
jgi:sulfur carrier protein